MKKILKNSFFALLLIFAVTVFSTDTSWAEDPTNQRAPIGDDDFDDYFNDLHSSADQNYQERIGMQLDMGMPPELMGPDRSSYNRWVESDRQAQQDYMDGVISKQQYMEVQNRNMMEAMRYDAMVQRSDAIPVPPGGSDGMDGAAYLNSLSHGSDPINPCAIGIYGHWLEGCLFCPLFTTLFNAAQKMSNHAANTFGNSFANLLALGMALFVAYETMKLVGSLGQQDARKYIQTIGIQFFKMLIAFMFLKYTSQFYNLFINPLLLAGFDFGDRLITSTIPAVTAPTPEKGLISAEVHSRLYSFLTRCQQEIKDFYALGRALVCLSFDEAAGAYEGYIPNFSLWLEGALIVCMGILLIGSFGFLLIDSIVQLGIFGAVLPFAIACWPFKITNKFGSAAWGMFIGVFLTFAFAGLILHILLELIASAVSTGGDGGDSLSFRALYEYMGEDHSPDDIVNLISSDATGLMIVIACAVIGWRLCGKIKDYVGKFYNASTGPGIGSKMGAEAAGVAKNVGKTAVKGAVTIGKGVGKGVWGGTKDMAKSGWDKLTGGGSGGGSGGGGDAGGGDAGGGGGDAGGGGGAS